MTTEDLIAIAKARGWKYYDSVDNTYNPAPAHWTDTEGKVYWDESCLLVFNSLDSIQQAVLMQDEEFQIWFVNKLKNKSKTLQIEKYPNLAISNAPLLPVLDWQQAFAETLKQLKRV